MSSGQFKDLIIPPAKIDRETPAAAGASSNSHREPNRCGVRYVRHQFLSDTLSNQHYDSDANMRMKAKVLRAFLRPNPPDMSMEALRKFMTSTQRGPHKLATILLEEAKKLLAMDRYERVLPRRKLAIRAFDAARRQAASARE